MHQILITGRMTRRTLDRALYSGWTVRHWNQNGDGIVAVVAADIANGSPDYMAGRLASFGTVGVRTEFTEAELNDLSAALDRA